MANINGKGAKGKATRLHSLFVRQRANYICEHCGRKSHPRDPKTGKIVKTEETGQIQCAHIISRHMVATRTDEMNAFALCSKCHWHFGKWPIEFAEFVYSKIGKDEYDRLSEKAKAGKGVKVDWDAEVARLEIMVANQQQQK